jgi:hypothetical protein
LAPKECEECAQSEHKSDRCIYDKLTNIMQDLTPMVALIIAGKDVSGLALAALIALPGRLVVFML